MASTCYKSAGNLMPNFLAVNFYMRSDGGGVFDVLDRMNGQTLCGCSTVYACQIKEPMGLYNKLITDYGLYQRSMAKCIANLSSVSLWGLTAITDNGVVQLISRVNSLQNLNIGGTFTTDSSLFAIADNCPHLKSIVLWGCRHVTENGLLVLVNKCRKLESVNVWGIRVPLECFSGMLTISPALQIQLNGMTLSDQRLHLRPVYWTSIKDNRLVLKFIQERVFTC